MDFRACNAHKCLLTRVREATVLVVQMCALHPQRPSIFDLHRYNEVVLGGPWSNYILPNYTDRLRYK